MTQDIVEVHKFVSSDEELPDSHLRAAFAYWQGMRGSTGAPANLLRVEDLPAEVHDHSILIELEGDPPRLRFSFVGARCIGEYGKDFTGTYADDHPGTSDSTSRASLCANAGLPYLYSGPAPWPRGKAQRYSCLVMPFTREDGRCCRLLICSEYH